MAAPSADGFRLADRRLKTAQLRAADDRWHCTRHSSAPGHGFRCGRLPAIRRRSAREQCADRAKRDGHRGAVATLRHHVQAVDATMPIFRARTLPQVRHDADWNGRLSNRLFLFLTFIAVALATVGLYAVTAHGVSQQRHEIGIRMALGARPAQIARRVLRHALVQGGIGFGVGIACAALWASVFPSGDAEIRATDIGSLAIVGAILLAVILIAAAVPMRRATRLNPLTAIRAE